MRRLRLVIALSSVVLIGGVGRAQHCAPIVESYLGEISVKHVGHDISVRVAYAKNGGRPHEAYQAYLVAYLDRDADKAPASPPHPLIDDAVVLVLHTGVVRRDATGRYPLEYTISYDEMAKKVIAHAKLTDEDREAPGGWGGTRTDSASPSSCRSSKTRRTPRPQDCPRTAMSVIT